MKNRRHFLPLLLFLLFCCAGAVHLSAQPCLPDGIQFKNQLEIDAFPTNHPGCTQIQGNITILQSNNIDNLDGLRGITTAGGTLRIVENRSLTNLHGLAALTSVGGNLTVAGNHSLVDLQGLEAVETVGGNLSIDDNASLTNAEAMKNLVSVGGRFGVYNCEMLPSLNGFNALKTVGSYLDIHNNDALLEINGFQSLETAGGVWIIDGDRLRSIGGFSRLLTVADNVDIRDHPALESIPGFQKLATIGNHFVLDNNAILTDLGGFSSLRSTGKSMTILRNKKLPDLAGLRGITTTGGLEIRENESLASLAGLDELTALTGLLQLVNNPSLTDLSALLRVTSIKGTLQIVDNSSLATLEGLDNIDYSTVNILTITGCGKLSACSVPAICDYLNFGSNATLAANATGCNSKQEVISADAACAPNFASQAKSLWRTEQGRWLLALVAAAVLAAIGAWFFYRQRQRTRLLQLRIAIAQDIHDEAGAGLTKIGLSAQVAALSQPSGNEDLQQKLEAIVAETRNVSASLGEVLFAVNPRYDHFEAVQAWLREWSRRFLEDARMEVDFDFPKSKHDPVLPPEVKRNLLLICKEALNNAVKYSGSQRVRLSFSLAENGRNYVLLVQDFGRGFSPDEVETLSNGIAGMKSRAAALKAVFSIQSLPGGQGTVVSLKGEIGA